MAASAAVDALFLVPRVVLGTAAAMPLRESLDINHLTAKQRGIVGCAAIGIGYLALYTGYVSGGVVGIAACGLGVLCGVKGATTWATYATIKGTQVGSLIGTLLVMPADLARSLMRALISGAMEAGTAFAFAGDLIGQLLDLVVTGPNADDAPAGLIWLGRALAAAGKLEEAAALLADIPPNEAFFKDVLATVGTFEQLKKFGYANSGQANPAMELRRAKLGLRADRSDTISEIYTLFVSYVWAAPDHLTLEQRLEILDLSLQARERPENAHRCLKLSRERLLQALEEMGLRNNEGQVQAPTEWTPAVRAQWADLHQQLKQA